MVHPRLPDHTMALTTGRLPVPTVAPIIFMVRPLPLRDAPATTSISPLHSVLPGKILRPSSPATTATAAPTGDTEIMAASFWGDSH